MCVYVYKYIAHTDMHVIHIYVCMYAAYVKETCGACCLFA